ncbi:MAG: NADH-quinone oxidoreductase subunit K [Candidatus Bipolaricaulota bacterium]|nr:NADH-quinone oxidoreductase subunit K [Candidatus Bipolaricaulota bacterium]
MEALYSNMYYVGAGALILVGLYIILVKSNLIKVIIGIHLLDTGVNVLLVAVGYIKGGTAPIFTRTSLAPTQFVDPIPQALVLTAIVIGVGVLALALSIVVKLYENYGTLDVRKIKGLKW